MKIAYLIFAYKNPKLIKKEIEQLSSENCGFFIHIDQKSDLSEFSEIKGHNIAFSDVRIPVYWAEFSGIEAILVLIKRALIDQQGYDYLVLLSGSDYPLRSAVYIESFFERNRGAEFMSVTRLPAPGKPISRLNTLRYPSAQPLRRFLFKGFAKLGLAQRDHQQYLGPMTPYGGNTWWSLSRAACEYILNFIAENPRAVTFFRNVFAPEELFFHTILGNSVFKPNLRRNLLYEDWSTPGAHPATITAQHIAKFESSDQINLTDMYGPGEFLFARKFSDESLELLTRIDQIIRTKNIVIQAV